jgi:YD repeat-containing protein
VPRSESVWELDTVTDPDGNVARLVHASVGGKRQLRRVEDAAGRRLHFTYQDRELALWEGEVLVAVTGPDGIEVRFDYDTYGNLISAEREERSRIESYHYERVPSWSFEARWALTEAVDGLDGATSAYAYQVADVQAMPGESVSSLLVRSVRLPEQVETDEGGTTTFDWDAAALAARTPATHRVTDGRSMTSRYTFNNYGNPLTIVDPLGNRTVMEWDEDNLVMTRKVDANQTGMDATYDEFGNLLSTTVTVTDFDGTEHTYTVTNTYLPDDQPPYQRNLLASHTDRNGHTTTYTYDDNGNLLSQSIEVTDARGETTTLTTHHTYAANGDRLTTTDPRGGVTRFLYDAYGNLETVIDPLGNRTVTRWDVRGRPVSVTDANGKTTYMTYDDRGRVVRREYPDGGIETTDYFDTLNLQIVTDPLNGITTTTRDREGRKSSSTTPRATRSSRAAGSTA